MPPSYFSLTTLLHRLSQLRRRRPDHVLPFRVPFFRIFYSTTYTTLFLITLVVLAISPGTLLWTSISSEAYQYVFMIGGTYVLTALIAIFIYSSRLYTNRSVLAGVGKAYIPVEEGEVGRNVRKMIASQLERSVVVAWESRPRDAMGEVVKAEKEGWLVPREDEAAVAGFEREEWTVGTAVVVDPGRPPWGDVSHAGWTAPTHARGETLGNLQFATVIAELPHLIEARAVSLAPPDPNAEAGFFDESEEQVADAVVVDALRRQKTMGLREYLTQLSYLGLINPPAVGKDFLSRYERARFCGRPISEPEFNSLMAVFAQLLEGMAGLHPDIVAAIRAQASSSSDDSLSTIDADALSLALSEATGSVLHFATPEPPRLRLRSGSASSGSTVPSPVTARTAFSRAVTPYLQDGGLESEESLSSVVRVPPLEEEAETPTGRGRSSFAVASSLSLRTLDSDVGSVLRHHVEDG